LKNEDEKIIIIVDDDKFIRDSHRKLIMEHLKKTQQHYYYIHEAADGIDCLYLVYKLLNKKRVIEYILIDETMKYLSGSKCSTILTNMMEDKLIPYIKIFMITSYNEQIIKYENKGIVKIFAKPLKSIDLELIFKKE